MAGIKELCRLTELPEEKLQAVFDAIWHLSRAGMRVTIRNFGSFHCKHRNEREIKSPKLPGGKAKVKEAMILWFNASPATTQIVKARGQAKKKERKDEK